MGKSKFLMLIAALVLAPSLCYSAEFRRASTFEDCFGASCRVSVSNARGTGTFVGYDAERGRCIVLTNYHVVTTNNTARLDFWTNGRQESVDARVFSRYYNAQAPYDFALLEVDPGALKQIDPPYIALAGQGTAPAQNSYVVSSGAPKGRNVQSWKGTIVGYYQGSTVEFRPAPVPGQSGSAIVSQIDGELWVTGVLTWLIGTEGSDDSKGGAIPIANLYKALSGRQTAGASFDPIPPNATECAERAPYVYEFVRDDCPPCKRAEKDADAIRSAGYELTLFNASLADGGPVAKSYGVKAAPTFIVFDACGVEQGRFEGAGKSSEIVAKLEELSKIEAPPAPIVQEPPRPEEETVPLSYADGSSNFRARPSVSEPDSFRTGFFEDSDSCWRNRLGGLGGSQDRGNPREEHSIAPSERLEDSGKLIDRLGDSIYERFKKSLDESAEAIENRVESKASAKLAELQSSARAWWAKQRARLVCLAFFLIFAAFLFSFAVLRILRVVVKDLSVVWNAFAKTWTAEEEQDYPQSASASKTETAKTVKKTAKKTAK